MDPHVQHRQSVSRRFRDGLLAVWSVVIVVGTPTHAADPSPAAARAPLPSRDAQERARVMARELVATSLDVQMRQLEDNGLERLPLHAEIKAMRGNIEGLVGNEMQGVVDLLAKAESAQPGDQAEAVQEARRLIRHVTVRLSAERQMLLRRLKVADIAAQVRRLTGQQSGVLKATESLPQQLPGRREAVTLTALEQQRTTGSLYGVLVASLEDVRTWEGPVGAAATESLRRLREGQAEVVLKAAEQRLATSDFAAAAAAQRQVLDLLATLEQRIERSQGASASRADAAVAAVRDMQRQREELRAEIAKAPPTDAAIEALVEKQAELRQDLNKLDDVAATAPDVAPLVQRRRRRRSPPPRNFSRETRGSPSPRRARCSAASPRSPTGSRSRPQWRPMRSRRNSWQSSSTNSARRPRRCRPPTRRGSRRSIRLRMPRGRRRRPRSPNCRGPLKRSSGRRPPSGN